MERHALVEQLDEAVLEVARAVVEVDLVGDVPIAPNLEFAVFDQHRMAGRQLFDALEERLVADAVLEHEIFGESRGIGRDFRQERQERLRFGGEHHLRADHRVIKRLDAEAIARAEKALRLRVPQGKGEHAAQLLQALDAPARIGREQDFGVAGRAVVPMRRQCPLQFEVVVDFAVVGDDRARRIGHRLLPGVGQIDDGEAAMRQSDLARRRRPDALAIGAAMGNQLGHDFEPALQPLDPGARTCRKYRRCRTSSAVTFPGAGCRAALRMPRRMDPLPALCRHPAERDMDERPAQSLECDAASRPRRDTGKVRQAKGDIRIGFFARHHFRMKRGVDGAVDHGDRVGIGVARVERDFTIGTFGNFGDPCRVAHDADDLFHVRVVLLERHVVPPRLQDPGIVALIEHHQRAQRRRFKASRRNLVQAYPAFVLGKIEPIELLVGRIGVVPQMGPDPALDLAGEVEDAGAALDAQRRLAARHEIGPRGAVEAILFAAGNVGHEIVFRRVGEGAIGDLRFLLSQAAEIGRQLPAAVTDVDRSSDGAGTALPSRFSGT